MFDSFKQLLKSDAEKRQDMITTYLDGELSTADRRRFEQLMTADSELRQEVERQRLIKLNIGSLPRLKAPRNFTLDPQEYGRPVSQGFLQLYPAMRLATVLVGIFFVIAVGAAILDAGGTSGISRDTAMLSQSQEPATAEEVVVESEAALAPQSDIDQALPAEAVLDAEAVAIQSQLTAEKVMAEEAPLAEVVEEVAVTMEVETAEEEAAIGLGEDGALTLETESADEEIVLEEAAVEELLGSPAPPSGVGGEKPEEPMTANPSAAADRASSVATATATSQATPSPLPPTEPSNMAALIEEGPAAEEDVGVVSGRDDAQLFQTREPAADSQTSGSTFPIIRLVTIALGIGLLTLIGATLLIRRRIRL